jgi:hypothetical protein
MLQEAGVCTREVGYNNNCFSPAVLLFSQFPYLELDMINMDLLLLYVSMDHKAHDWFPASA